MTADLVYEDRLITGEELDLRARRLAGGLTSLGVGEGDVVAVMVKNHPAFIDLMLACRVLGAHYCPINWHFRSTEAEHILRDSGARALIIEEAFLREIAEIIPAVLSVIAIDGDNGEHPDYDSWLSRQPEYSGGIRAPRGMMPYTSGTTGKPKGVCRLPLGPEHPPAMQALSEQVWGVKAGVRTLMPAPLYHSAPNSMTLQTLLHGDLLVLTRKFDAEAILRLIQRHGITTVYLVPIMYVRLLRLPESVKNQYDISSVRFVASTGASCAPELKAAMLAWWGEVIYETYASSETGMLTVQTPEGARIKPGSVGKPVLNAEIKIVGDDGKECPIGETGVIYGRQPAYPDFTYQNNPAARAKAGLGALITVGDVGYVDEDGYLYVCDRVSDMVISGGVNIYPAEIEHALLELPEVLDCAVFGIPDHEYGESLVGLVKCTGGADQVMENIRNYLVGRLANYKIPRDIRIVDDLPRDDNGKVSKRKLKQEFSGS
ncbi:AMP-binding protein [Alcanivorax sp. 24]|uniref:AMP-binding protein n=1 Tax=Alcanivorax sp. 24 TaxID=2545266 RepID=UPI00105BFEE9|nr:AMP-binding protein [Alcanivorax sp. 24]